LLFRTVVFAEKHGIVFPAADAQGAGNADLTSDCRLITAYFLEAVEKSRTASSP
jgi:hypothetical protein